MIGGAIVPHAPLLLSEVPGEQVADRVAEVVRAVGEVDLRGTEALVVISSHGARTAIHSSATGTLGAFSVPGVESSFPTNEELASALASATRLPTETASIDHGALVPLMLVDPDPTPVVVATVAEDTGPHGADVACSIADGRRIAGGLRRAASDRDVFVLASAHLSAAMSPRAPLTELPEGPALSRAVLEALGSDVGALDDIPASLWTEAGSCGAGPLSAFGRLFRGRKAEVRCETHPFGVKYLVAEIA